MNLLVEYDMVLHFNHFEIQLDDLQNLCVYVCKWIVQVTQKSIFII